MEKFFIRTPDFTVLALRYDTKLIGAIGGNKKFRGMIEEILDKFFRLDSPPIPNFPQRNKIRYDFKCSWQRYKDAKKAMTECGILLEPTTTHYRIMS